jgi:hypothetical protein
MSSNGNGKWFESYWTKKGGYVVPRESGWYAAIPENCDSCIVRVHLEPNLYHCKAEGDDFVREVYDYRYWYKLKSPYDSLPNFP